MSDLIKTLRGMDEYWQPTLYNQAADALEAKEAQIERLRAALQDIVDCVTHDYSRRDIQATALAALEGTKGTNAPRETLGGYDDKDERT
jgi:hypothetical protein